MGRRGDDVRARLLEIFRVEANEHLASLGASLLALERGVTPEEERELVQSTFREVHTLKGAARSVGLLEIEALCQACESILSRVSRGQLELTAAVVAELERALDGVEQLLGDAPQVPVRELVRALERAAADGPGAAQEAAAADVPVQPAVEQPPALDPPAAPPGPAGEPRAADGDRTIRLSTRKLDALLFQGEDMLAGKLAAEERADEAAALLAAVARCRARLGRGAEPALQAQLQELEAQARGLLGRLRRDRRALAASVDGLLDELRRVRMLPAATVLDLFPRMVRDLARDQGKEVDCVVRGAELEVDRKVLETVKEPLIHLVRNAVDHGIEPPARRREAGKPPRGRVEVAVARAEGGRVELVVADDGRGIDPDAVRAAAVRMRLLSADAAEALGDADARGLVYRSGLSTSPVITEVSGHGLGLAIVREHVERLEGRVEHETAEGSGTRVRLLVPATIATFRGLLVCAGGQEFLLPLEAVERALRVRSEELGAVEGRPALVVDGRALPAVRLGLVLGLGAGERAAAEALPCLVVRAGERRIALLVDEIRGEREALVKELRPPLLRVRHVAAAGLLGSGRIVPILRPADLVRAPGSAPRPPVAPAGGARTRQAAVLVVDDAVTTRTMERSVLEAAGYRVRVAVDGVDAWTALAGEEFDLVVSDVDMPRLDGFGLTARIRSDARLAGLPVVLVTALESREDKERGVEVGANAYVVKSSFEQSNLLEIIRRLGVPAELPAGP